MADPTAHVILPEIISKEPLGPLVRHGDHQWGDVVRWTLNAMIIAEELGVTAANVDEMKGANNPEIKRLLGTEGDMGAQLNLASDWAYNIVKMVGNYGEVYERYMGASPEGLGIPREGTANALWTDGGLMYSPPFR